MNPCDNLGVDLTNLGMAVRWLAIPLARNPIREAITDLLVPSVDSVLSRELTHGRPLRSPSPKGAPSPMPPPVVVLKVTRLQVVGLAMGGVRGLLTHGHRYTAHQK